MHKLFCSCCFHLCPLKLNFFSSGQVKSGRHRSSSPASSSGLRRDLTPSPALSDTLSADSYSSPGESKTDFISRRVSPRFLKEQKSNPGPSSLSTKEKTEVKVDSLIIETTDKNEEVREGSRSATLELDSSKSETDSAKVVPDEERTESMEVQLEHGHVPSSMLPERILPCRRKRSVGVSRNQPDCGLGYMNGTDTPSAAFSVLYNKYLYSTIHTSNQ